MRKKTSKAYWAHEEKQDVDSGHDYTGPLK